MNNRRTEQQLEMLASMEDTMYAPKVKRPYHRNMLRQISYVRDGAQIYDLEVEQDPDLRQRKAPSPRKKFSSTVQDFKQLKMPAYLKEVT